MARVSGTRWQRAIGLIVAYAFLLQAWFAVAGAAAAAAAHVPSSNSADIVCTSGRVTAALDRETQGRPRHDFVCGFVCSLAAFSAAGSVVTTTSWAVVAPVVGSVLPADLRALAAVWLRVGRARAPPATV
jgi:hypothetical protein